MATLDEIRAQHGDPNEPPPSVETARDPDLPPDVYANIGSRVCLYPGLVASATDGRIHRVGIAELARLYGLSKDQQLRARVRGTGAGAPLEKCEDGERVCLFPQADGNYKLSDALPDRFKAVKDAIESGKISIPPMSAGKSGAAESSEYREAKRVKHAAATL